MSAPGLKIGIDIRAASHPQSGGFKTYVKNLIWGLSRVDHRNHYYLYADRPFRVEPTPDFDGRRRIDVVGPDRIPLAGPVWREQVLLPVRARSDRVDVIHGPTGTLSVWSSAPAVVTVHDAIEQMAAMHGGAEAVQSGGKRRFMRLYYDYVQRLTARKATIVITVSECSRRDIIRFLRVTPDRVRVVPEAPGPEFYRPGTDGVARIESRESDPFILAIGSADPRKNLLSLIRAYAALPADLISRYRLVLVWTHQRLREQVLARARDCGVAERITSVSAPSDGELRLLYESATVFVFPSLYEGFGLPPLEAMACGTPVIASNTSSLPEILGDAALLVDPRSIKELTAALTAVLRDTAKRRELATRGVEWVARYSWERTAAETLAVYEEAAMLAAPSPRFSRATYRRGDTTDQ